MKKNLLNLCAVVALTFMTLSASAQFRYKVDYRMLLDNLENSAPYAVDRTIAGASITPLVGAQFGNHSIMAGAHVLAEFGTTVDIDKTQLRAYYQYQDSKFRAYAGIFSAYVKNAYPLQMFITSAPFLNDQISGLYGEYKTGNGYIETWLDWSKSNRAEGVDHFAIGINGERKWKGFTMGLQSVYRHFADEPLFVDFTVLDRLQYNAYFKYDFARHQDVFDVLSISAGVSGDANRVRDDADEGFKAGTGFQTEQMLSWKGLSFQNTLYTGSAQMNYKEEFPIAFSASSPFYNTDFMDKIILKYVYKYKWLTVSAVSATYFVPDTVAWQQILVFSFSLDDVINFKKK